MSRRLGRPLLAWFAFGALMCLVPLVAGTGTVRILIFAMSWDVISGRTGYISFGHPFLIGLAAYTTAMLTYHLDAPPWLSIPAGILVTMMGGTLFFLPALRIRGTCFALVTLALMKLIHQLTQVIAPKLTGGTRGLSGILELRDVTRRFGGLTALDRLSLHVERGESLGLIGPNGAGKTTAFSIVMGEHRPNSGGVYFEDEDITCLPTHARVTRGVARTYQVPRPFAEIASRIRFQSNPAFLGIHRIDGVRKPMPADPERIPPPEE